MDRRAIELNMELPFCRLDTTPGFPYAFRMGVAPKRVFEDPVTIVRSEQTVLLCNLVTDKFSAPNILSEAQLTCSPWAQSMCVSHFSELSYVALAMLGA